MGVYRALSYIGASEQRVKLLLHREWLVLGEHYKTHVSPHYESKLAVVETDVVR